MKKQKKIYVVPHSHWDREWYFTIEDSNVLLTENVNYLIDVLEQNKEFNAYILDAQMSVVEEYLEICPEQRDRLKTLIKEKRIFVGPWYTQTDSLLVNKESIIRNLLYGTRLANEMGHSMKVGYLPDIFGQNAYLPSIFKGFEIEHAILQRGIYTDQLKKNLNFMWESPDGKTVKTNNLYLGYGPGKFLSSEDEYLNDRLLPMINVLADLNKSTNHFLLPSGGDQVLIRKELPKIINELNEKDSLHEYVLSNYETFMNETWKDPAVFKNYIKGELTACQKSRIHNTIRSQRYDIKKLNYVIENKILYILEPLAVIGETLGLKYPQKWLDQMWKLLFDVHAHDSIGGCNSDETNHDIVSRLHKVNRITDGLLNILKKQLTWAISKKVKKKDISVVFNTSPKVYTGAMETVIFSEKPSFSIQTLEGQTVTFEAINQVCISGGKRVIVTAQGEKEIEIPNYYRTVVNIQTKDVPAMGYITYVVNEEINEMKRLEKEIDNTIENKKLKLVFNENRIVFNNLMTGQTIDDVITFENVADAGDSYDFSPLQDDEPIIIQNVSMIEVKKGSQIQTMIIKHECRLPKDLKNRQSGNHTELFEIETKFELRHDEPIVHVKHVIQNNVCDHRVRVRLKLPIQQPSYSYADQGFSVVKRSTVNPYLKDWRENKFVEAPVPIYPLENFIAISENDVTFALLTKGIKEYEVLAEASQLALTLYRSVGLLGRDDLLWRPGRASGINNKIVPTPDAQLLNQTLTFEYAIYIANEALQPERLFQLTEMYLTRYATYQLQNLNTFEERLERFDLPKPVDQLSSRYSMFHINNDDVFMSTCKRAYEGDGVIIRLFNPTEKRKTVSIHTDIFSSIILTNLYERELKKVGGTLQIEPKGYVTIKLK